MKRLISVALMVLVSMVGMVGVSSVAAQTNQAIMQQLQKLQQQLQRIEQSLDSLQSTVEEIPPAWSQILPASTRFVLVLGGAAVLDHETGLVWQRTADSSASNWLVAINVCQSIRDGGRLGWRLPTIEELNSLIDPSMQSPALPSGHPFYFLTGYNGYWWSGTTVNMDNTCAWTVNFNLGFNVGYNKANPDFKVWCVRGGQIHNYSIW